MLEAVFDEDAKGTRITQAVYTFFRSAVIVPLMYLTNKASLEGGAAGDMGATANYSGEGGMAVAESGSEIVEDAGDAVVEAHEGRREMARSAAVRLQAQARGMLDRKRVQLLKSLRETADVVDNVFDSLVDAADKAVDSLVDGVQDLIDSVESASPGATPIPKRLFPKDGPPSSAPPSPAPSAEPVHQALSTRGFSFVRLPLPLHLAAEGQSAAGKRSRIEFQELVHSAKVDLAARKLQQRWRHRLWLRCLPPRSTRYVKG